MKRLLIPLACTLALGAPALAHASAVCTTGFVPGSTSLGGDGYLYAFYTSQPGCAGTWEGAKYYCTSGATSSLCASSTSYVYSLSGLLALFDALREAAVEGQRMYPVTTACNGGAYGCGSYVQFEAT